MTPEMCNLNKFDYNLWTLFMSILEICVGSGMSVGSCTHHTLAYRHELLLEIVSSLIKWFNKSKKFFCKILETFL